MLSVEKFVILQNQVCCCKHKTATMSLRVYMRIIVRCHIKNTCRNTYSFLPMGTDRIRSGTKHYIQEAEKKYGRQRNW